MELCPHCCHFHNNCPAQLYRRQFSTGEIRHIQTGALNNNSELSIHKNDLFRNNGGWLLVRRVFAERGAAAGAGGVQALSGVHLRDLLHIDKKLKLEYILKLIEYRNYTQDVPGYFCWSF